MKRFLITNEHKFTGQAELVYNSNNTLCIIDCSNTNMDERTMQHFKQAVPVSLPALDAAFKAPTVIVEAGFEVSFDKFYSEYPLKRNRYKAEKVWPRLTNTEQVQAYYSLSNYKKYLTRNQWQNPMLADSFLSRKEFLTEWNKIK